MSDWGHVTYLVGTSDEHDLSDGRGGEEGAVGGKLCTRRWLQPQSTSL